LALLPKDCQVDGLCFLPQKQRTLIGVVEKE